ncbi:MAG: glycoside hydrolase family 88 protein [Prevotella sp.]|nr:glycoside hydrolase family 88 protein [Prevotella sp.]
MKTTTRQLLLMTLLVMTGVTNAIAGTNISLRFTADDAKSSITSNITIGDFTIYATNNNSVTIDASTKTYNNISFTHRLKLGNTRNTNSRIIGFPVEGPCKITTYGMTSSKDNDRWLVISAGTSPLGSVLYGTTADTRYCFSNTYDMVAETYEYTGEATNIYIGSYNNGYNIYGIDVTYGEGSSTETRYTVSFNANTNGTCSTSSLTEASEGAGVTLPTATANYGYNFLGWSTSSTATTASYNAGATYKPSANITLYAIYEVDANAPVLPAAGSAMTFDATKRYSEWVINSRLSDFYGNEKVMNFAKYTDDGTKTVEGKTVELDYVPGLVAKAVLETIDYYKNNKDINVKPWFYAVQDYANNTIKSDGADGKSFDDLNAVKLYFKLQEVAKAGIIPDAADTNISNTKSITTANTRLGEALAGIKIANRDYAISESLLPGAAGGWWHKSGYTNQMWCDGQYMGPALLAQMLNEYDNYENDGYIAGSKEADWDLVTKQFTISWNYLWNPEVKLLYHAFTADPECTADTNAKTNASKWAGFPNSDGVYHSAEYWGRAEGWYFLALVDVLEQMQIAGLTRTDNYKTLHGYLNELAAGIAAKQDAATGCWYQLLNHDGTFVAQSYSGSSYTSNPVANYLESSASAIFTAAYLKGMRLGLYDTDYTAIAKKAYQGIVEQFMVADGNGGVHLVCCSKSAGLGSSSNRDGSAEYYLMGEDTEPTSKDPNAKTHDDKAIFYTEGKVFGGFILAATEYERLFLDKKLELTEAGEYTGFAAGEYDEVTLTRSFPTDQWTTMVVPFSASAEQVQTAFGNGTEIATINGLTNDKLYFTKQNAITANEPVLIKVATVNSDNTYTFNNVTVENYATPIQSGNGAQLIGTYALLTGGQSGDLGATDYFIYNNQFYDCTYMGRMKPFRAYITLTTAGAKLTAFSFTGEEDTTPVNTVGMETSSTPFLVYNIAGQRISNNATHELVIRKGIKETKQN